jgi:hypothetical protein
MNKILLIVVLISFGCTPDKSDNKNTLDNESERLNGYWLSDNYLNTIEKTKSIYKSKEYNTKFWGFTLDKQNLLSDSAVLNGFTEHEGGYSCYLIYNTAKNAFVHNLSMAREYEYLKDIPFELHLIDSNKLELGMGEQKEIYRKVADEQTALRHILFTGKYQDLKNKKTIEFADGGQIIGIENRHYFDLVFDFGEGIEYDAAIFYVNSDSSGLWTNGDMYHYKINGDTLKLYELHTDWEEMNHKIGDLKYELKRR